MKSNDSIPADEMLLAEAYAAARARRLAWCKERAFAKPSGIDWDPLISCKPREATHACALGALDRAGALKLRGHLYFVTGPFAGVTEGNDLDVSWSESPDDAGASLGWAFRCAMTQDESDPDTERLIRKRSAS